MTPWQQILDRLASLERRMERLERDCGSQLAELLDEVRSIHIATDEPEPPKPVVAVNPFGPGRTGYPHAG